MEGKQRNMSSTSGRRSSLIMKNIAASLLVKGWSGCVQLLLVPATLFCLGNYENGIWMTISSMLVWVDSLDIGLGNGLRNRLASQLAVGDWQGARTSVSSALGMLVILIMPVVLLMLLLVNAIDVYSLLNVDANVVGNLRQVLMMSVALIGVTFIFKFVGNVYMALQLPAVNNVLVTTGQTLVLVAVLGLERGGVHSLLLVALAYTLAPLLVYLVAFPVTFLRFYPGLRPSPSCFSWKAVGGMLTLGVKFFVLQIAGIVLFASSNILISHFFSPDMVTPYQVCYRYFSLMVILFTIVVTPFWSATTDAFAKGDMEWIRASMRKIHRLMLLVMLVLCVMVALATPIYRLWVGAGVHIPLMMSAMMAAYIFVILCSMSYSYLLNGMGALRLQLVFTVSAALAYIPLAYACSRTLGLYGMMLALVLVNLPGLVANVIQFNKIVYGHAEGIWLR